MPHLFNPKLVVPKVGVGTTEKPPKTSPLKLSEKKSKNKLVINLSVYW